MISEAVKREKIEKIRKLQRQAESTDFAPERELCLQRIEQIMEEYQILAEEMEDLPIGDIGASELDGLTNEFTVMRHWESVLAYAVADIFDCTTVRDRGRRRWKTVFIGSRERLMCAIHFYDFLRRAIDKSATEKFSSSEDQATYSQMFTNVVSVRLRDKYKQRQQEVGKESTALVHLRRKEVDRVRDDLFPEAEQNNERMEQGNRDALLQGMRDGEEIPLSRPVEQGEDRRTIK